MKFADYLDNKVKTYLYKVYSDASPHAIDPQNYDKYRNYDLDIITDDDYDEEGNNYAIVWGYLTKSQEQRKNSCII